MAVTPAGDRHICWCARGYDLRINTALLIRLTSRAFQVTCVRLSGYVSAKIIPGYRVSVSTMFDSSPLLLVRRVHRAGFVW